MRKSVVAGAAVGAAALGGALIYYFREKATPGPTYRTLESDGEFEIRSYPEMTVAETIVEGPRRESLSEGFRILADYIFAKSRPGEELPMTVPVLQDGGNPMASDPPMFDDEVEGAWRLRFVMPDDRQIDDLPSPPGDITLVTLPARKLGAVKFAGSASDGQLEKAEDRLRGWLARRGEHPETQPEFAFYNSPMIPPPLRRNEVLIPLT